MPHVGDMICFQTKSGVMTGVILDDTDLLNRYPVLFLEPALPDIAPNLRLSADDLPPGISGQGDLAIDPYQSHRIPADKLEKTMISHPMPVRGMDKIFRAMGMCAARGEYRHVHAPRAFEPGISPVPASAKSWGEEEMVSLTDAALDFWLTAGRFCHQFEDTFAKTVGRQHALAVNSGSSANLLAMSVLCSPALGEKRLKHGDEVLTVAAAFPTTVAPIVQLGLTPVFVDVTPPTFNVDTACLAAAVGPRTRAIFLAHTLGNPFDLDAVQSLACKHGLWLVEDTCDALGSRYTADGEGQPRMCGSFGHLATYSFYPAHHITMGEGGAVVCDDPRLWRIARSLRDWGRDCWCPPGCDDTCKRRYQWEFTNLPKGYDHKYVYSHLGYNLKITDMQAAVGLRQLERLENFARARRRNFDSLYEALLPLENEMQLPEPTPKSEPAWFGFPVLLRPHVDRTDLLHYLNTRRIGTRLLFAGNIVRQPCFAGVRFRQEGDLTHTDDIMRRAFWVGCHPRLNEAHIRYMANALFTYFSRKTFHHAPVQQ